MFEIKQVPWSWLGWRFVHCLKPSTHQFTNRYHSRTRSRSLHYTCSFGDLAAVYFTNIFSDIIHVQMRCPFQLQFWKKAFSSQFFDSTWGRVGMERMSSWKTKSFLGEGFWFNFVGSFNFGLLGLYSSSILYSFSNNCLSVFVINCHTVYSCMGKTLLWLNPN